MPEHFRVKECKDDNSRQDWWGPCRLRGHAPTEAYPVGVGSLAHLHSPARSRQTVAPADAGERDTRLQSYRVRTLPVVTNQPSCGRTTASNGGHALQSWPTVTQQIRDSIALLLSHRDC
jgi:hypothetical protein